MIEQRENQLLISFPTSEAAQTFAQFLSTLIQSQECRPDHPTPSPVDQPASATSLQPSAACPAEELVNQSVPSPLTTRFQHTVLTEERQEVLYNQRAEGQTERQRLLRAQATLRDGALPFRKLSSIPPPSGQTSPRIKAQQSGGFADGSGPEPKIGGRSKLRVAPTGQPSPPSRAR